MNRYSSWFRGVAPIARLTRVTNGRNLTLGAPPKAGKIFEKCTYTPHPVLRGEKTPPCCHLKSQKKCRSPETQVQPGIDIRLYACSTDYEISRGDISMGEISRGDDLAANENIGL